MNIRVKFLLPVTVMLILAVGGVSTIGYINMRQETEKVMQVGSQTSLNGIISKLDLAELDKKLLNEALNCNFLRIARSVALLIRDNTENLSLDYFTQLAEEVGIDEIHVANNEGILYAGTTPAFYGFDFDSGDQSRPFLQLLEDENLEIAQEPQLRVADNVLFQYIGVPIKGRNEFVQIGVKPEELQNLLEEANAQQIIIDYPYREGEYVYILDPVLKICTHHVKNDLIGYDMTTLDFANRIFEKGDGDYTYIWQNNEIYTNFKTTPYGIVVSAIPTASYYSQLQPVFSALLITSVISLVLVFLILLFLIRAIIGPLKEINSSLLEISRGDANLTKRLEVKSQDEIGTVALNFNLFMEKLQRLIDGIKTAVTSTEEIKNEIVGNAKNSAASAQTINGNITAINSSLNHMGNQMAESSTALEQINTNTESFDRIITSQSTMVEESTAAITQMIASLNNVGNITRSKKDSTETLKRVTEEGLRQIEETSNDLAEVVTKISRIQEMAEIINGIASQTNLLSMNAAIEAAHAGESGKGFAVVAEEIRKLAETSSDSSGTISRLITEITSGVENTSVSMGSTLKTFESISREIDSTVNAFMEIENSVSELTVGGQQIMESTEKINDVTSDVNTGSKEIHKGIKTTNHSLIEFRQSSDAVTNSIQGIFKEVGENTQMMDKINRNAEELDEITQNLVDNFSRFTTG